MIFKKKMISVFFAGILSLSLFASSLGQVYGEESYHDKYARATIVSDLKTGRIIYEKNSNKQYAMASMSKIMTLLLTFDAIRDKKVNLGDIVQIKKEDVNREGTNMKLDAGDRIPLHDLMKGMMIISANDAALAIARYVGGSTNEFVKMMNNKAKEIGMNNTIFYNPNGLPYKIDKNGNSTENTTTASDVLTLSKWIYEHYPNELTKITSLKRFVFKPKNIDEENTNPLLPIMSNVDGLKTGFTDKAGYCLSYMMKTFKDKNNDVENRIFGVTMGSPTKEDRKESAYTALNYIGKYYSTKVLYDPNSMIKRVNINNFGYEDYALENKKPIVVIKKNTEYMKPVYIYNRVELWNMFDRPLASLYFYDQNGIMIAKDELYLQRPSEMDLKQRLFLFVSILKASIFNDNNTKNSPIVSLDMNKLKNMVKYYIEDSYVYKKVKTMKNYVLNIYNE